METIPFGGHPRVRNLEVHNCGRNRGGKWEEDVACQQGHRELSEEVEIDGNVEVLKGGC